MDGWQKYLTPSIALFEMIEDDLLPIKPIGIQVQWWCIFYFSFSLLGGNSDQGSLSRLFSPLPTTVRAFSFFYREKNRALFFPRPIRVKLRNEVQGCGMVVVAHGWVMLLLLFMSLFL